MANALTNFLRDLFTQWGDDLSLEPAKGPSRSLDVVLKLENREVVIVGRLTVADSRFKFAYTDGFKASDLPPLPGLLNKEEIYESDVLFPFFQVRLPPKSRDDVARVMKEHNMGDADIFEILRVLGRRTATSPYEFQTSPRHPAFTSDDD